VTIYTGFATFYDRIMGDRTEEVDRIRSYISQHMPAARNLLELGCGTGALLAGLATELAVTGIDQSPQMLDIARAAVPRAQLVQGDMTAFSLPGPFDVVICMFDTLNHVPSFDGWLSLFSCVHEHLADNGLDGNVVIMTVRSAHDGLSLWETRIFDRQHDDIYRLHHERIYELGVPLGLIRASLAGRFELLDETSLDGSPVSDQSDRVFFAYRHRGAGSGAR
jgi:SAM-dependent methyltransferase